MLGHSGMRKKKDKLWKAIVYKDKKDISALIYNGRWFYSGFLTKVVTGVVKLFKGLLILSK